MVEASMPANEAKGACKADSASESRSSRSTAARSARSRNDRDVDVVLEGRLPTRRHMPSLLGEPVERRAVVLGEPLCELEGLRAARPGRVGQA